MRTLPSRQTQRDCARRNSALDRSKVLDFLIKRPNFGGAISRSISGWAHVARVKSLSVRTIQGELGCLHFGRPGDCWDRVPGRQESLEPPALFRQCWSRSWGGIWDSILASSRSNNKTLIVAKISYAHTDSWRHRSHWTVRGPTAPLA